MPGVSSGSILLQKVCCEIVIAVDGFDVPSARPAGAMHRPPRSVQRIRVAFFSSYNRKVGIGKSASHPLAPARGAFKFDSFAFLVLAFLPMRFPCPFLLLARGHVNLIEYGARSYLPQAVSYGGHHCQQRLVGNLGNAKDASFDGPHCLSFKVITPRSISASHALELASEVLNAHCASQAGLRDMLRGMPICASQALRLARPANRPVNGIGCTAERCDPVSRLAMVAGFVRIGFKLVQLRRTTTLTPSQNFCQILLCHFLSKHALKR